MNDIADPDPALVVIHVDDVGMCHGANAAFAELSRIGVVDAGSVMVPCPWVSEAAALAAADPRLDLGVHVTLTSEKTYYRWGPVGRASRASGLVDDDGYLWRTVPDLVRHAHPEAVEAEIRAQVERALALGIDVTHLDDHMGAPFAPPFLDAYLRVGRDFRLPVLFPRDIAAYDPVHNFAEIPTGPYAERAVALAAEGHLVADRVLETVWSLEGTAEDRFEAILARIGPGLNFLALHPNTPGDVEAIEPDSAAIRIAEWRMFVAAGFRERIERLPIRRVSPRAWRDDMRRIAS